jgi:hypothetical protein
MWARFSTTLEQPPDSPMRNVTFCVNNVLVKADEMQVIEKSAGVRTFALRGTVTLTVPGWETAPAK